MTIEVSYRQTEPADKPAILAILRQNAPGIPESLRSAIFDWQFGADYVLAQGQSTFWVATVNGEVAGVNGMMPVRLWSRDQEVPAIWSCDTVVLEKFRGLGIGKELLQRVSNHAPVVMGYGISDMSDPILAKGGWLPFDGVIGLFCSINEVGVKGHLKNMASTLMRLISIPFRQTALDIAVSIRSASFDSSHDVLWTHTLGEGMGVVIRDTAYLNWRYRDHPSLRYEVVEAATEDTIRAILVIRHEPLESVIVDYVGEPTNYRIMTPLVVHAVRKLVEQGTRRIRCETSLPTLQKCLRQMGFRVYSGQFRFRSHVQQKLQPTEQLNWFVMAGDSDNDCSKIGKARNTISR